MHCTCLFVCISTCTYVGAVLVLLYFFTSILFFLQLNTRRCWWPAPCSSSSWRWAWLVTPRWTPPSMGRWRTSYTAYGSANQLFVKPLLLSVCEDEHWTGADTDDLLPGRNQAGHGHDKLQQDGNHPSVGRWRTSSTAYSSANHLSLPAPPVCVWGWTNSNVGRLSTSCKPVVIWIYIFTGIMVFLISFFNACYESTSKSL